jgi:integrase
MVTNRRIGKRGIATLQPGTVIWDGEVAGFGARRQKGHAVSYILFYRTAEGRQRWHTIGRHGSPWTPDDARKEARRLLGDVAGGGDPAAVRRAKRKAETVSDLCDLYLTDAETGRFLTRLKAPKKASTISTDKGRIEAHIKPLLGRKAVSSITREDVDAFMHDVAQGKTARHKKIRTQGAEPRGGKGAATRTVGLLGSIFTYAVRHRIRPDNPVRGVIRFADGRRSRRLSDNEYRQIGIALRAATGKVWPPAIAATRFLLVTGWRKGEVLGLQWSEVDLIRRTAVLGDTKTGLSVRPLSNAACDVLRSIGKKETGLVFPASKGDGLMTGYPKFWDKIATNKAVPSDITAHVFRHSFASLAGDLGYSDSTIGALIGHAGRTITSRYVHSADFVLLSAADAVAKQTLRLMGEKKEPTEIVTALRK